MATAGVNEGSLKCQDNSSSNSETLPYHQAALMIRAVARASRALPVLLQPPRPMPRPAVIIAGSERKKRLCPRANIASPTRAPKRRERRVLAKSRVESRAPRETATMAAQGRSMPKSRLAP